jgi:hypothetical protein
VSYSNFLVHIKKFSCFLQLVDVAKIKNFFVFGCEIQPIFAYEVVKYNLKNLFIRKQVFYFYHQKKDRVSFHLTLNFTNMKNLKELSRNEMRAIRGGVLAATSCGNSCASISGCNGVCSATETTVTCTGPTKTLTKTCTPT